jgi:hypothetical protein
MRIIRRAIAALVLTLAIPSAAQAATTITVSVAAPAAGDTTPFTFHVTGPTCGTTATDLTFVLRGGEQKILPLCDSPTDLAHRFHVTEIAPAGWKLTSIDCDAGNDPDPTDASVVDIPTATAFVELSPNEVKACAFSNENVPPVVVTPPVPVTTATPPAAGPAAAGAAPTSVVAGVQQRAPVAATARVRAQTRCGARTARVTVSGRRMRQVRFSINGRRVRTVAVGLGVRSIAALVPLRRSGAAVQTVRAQVTFRNGAAPRTLSASVRRCARAAVAPQFTG